MAKFLHTFLTSEVYKGRALDGNIRPTSILRNKRFFNEINYFDKFFLTS